MSTFIAIVVLFCSPLGTALAKSLELPAVSIPRDEREDITIASLPHERGSCYIQGHLLSGWYARLSSAIQRFPLLRLSHVVPRLVPFLPCIISSPLNHKISFAAMVSTDTLLHGFRLLYSAIW